MCRHERLSGVGLFMTSPTDLARRYGFGMGGTTGVLTPYRGFSLANEGSRTLRAGARWNIAPGATLLHRT